MKTIRIMVVAMLIVASGLALHITSGQQAGTNAPTCSGTI